MRELISVIVTTYNSSTTVVETLNSIKQQTYSPIDLVISDDNSLDDTLIIASEWISENRSVFHDVQLITSDKNTGISGNLSRGIEAIHTRLYKEIAGDDILRPNAIEVYAKYRNDDKIIYQANVASFQIQGGTKKFLNGNDKSLRTNNNFLKMDCDQQYRQLAKANDLNSVGIGLINIDDYKIAGGMDMRFPLMEDYPFALKLSEAGYTFRAIDETLVEYRVSSTSIFHNKSNRYLMNEADFFFSRRFKVLIHEGMILEALFRTVKYGIQIISCHLNGE